MGQPLISWEEAQQKIDSAERKMGGRAGTPQEMLKHAAVNKRHADVPQAKAISLYDVNVDNILLHLEDKTLITIFTPHTARVEQNQLAIAGKEDARNEFIETKVAEAMKANMGKGGASLNISTDSGGESGDS